MNEIAKKSIIFVILIVLILGIAQILLNFVLPIKPLKLISGNMEPTHVKGDILFYSQSENYNKGDVITHKTIGGPSVVRIVEINEDGTYKAKGDGNQVSINSLGLDETHIEKGDILGKVKFGISGVTFYLLFYGLQIIIAILLTFLVSSRLKQY